MYALYLTQNVIAINLNDILKIVSGQEKPQKQEVSEALQERRRPDLNRWILVLQTIALPLGYCAIFN